ncbi:MAG TPA: M90 family metallopeptidase [Burkholderiales bacterium]|nr:M90 family metallopeptidase [Burkholderiales bacterium]
MNWFTAWRRARIVRRARIDEALWRATLERYAFLRVLSAEERSRLAGMVALFLHDKAIHGAGGLEMRDEIRLAVAAQASILILNLDFDCYRGWVEVIVYPDEFVATYEFVDEDGIAHSVSEPMSGESWLQGPVILSWADARNAGYGGYNVVIHEFAHKLDMLNGDANGFPPLHADMDRARWANAFSAAYGDFCARVDRGESLPIDAYAAEDPGEFFAVLSEAFFEIPLEVRGKYPEVYRELAAFYRQNPASRIEASRAPAATATA